MSDLLTQDAQPQEQNTIVYIYGLVDPRTGYIRYVGKSIEPMKRYANHLYHCSLKIKSHKANWLRELLKSGLKPELIFIELVNISEWEEAEARWIAHYRNIPGYPALTNSTDGGEGVTGLVISEEHRKNISNAQKIKWDNASEEERKKMRRFPLPLTEELRQKIADGLRNANRPKGSTSAYRGVLKLDKPSKNPWRAACGIDGKMEYIGVFATEEQAARARDRFMLERFPNRNFVLNFPNYDYSIPEPIVTIDTVELRANNNTGYQGVCWSHGKWKCAIGHHGKTITVGYFPATTEGKIACARRYDIESIRLFGDAAKTNFPRSSYSAEEIAQTFSNAIIRTNNKSGFRGVAWFKKLEVWACFFQCKGVRRTQRFSGTEQGRVDAAHQYDRWTIQHHGVMARTNFPLSHYPDLLPPTP